MSNYYTENLADFGMQEIHMLKDILVAWTEKGLPENFWSTGVKPAMNSSSGYVFLVNEDYQVAMLNGAALEIYHTLPYSGHEGFLSDLIDTYKPEDLHEEDMTYLIDAADAECFTLPQSWLR